MTRIRFRKLFLICAAIILYTRIVVYIFRSADTEADMTLDSKLNSIARKHLSSLTENNEYIDLERPEDFNIRPIVEEAVEDSGAVKGPKGNSGVRRSGVAVTYKENTEESTKEESLQSLRFSTKSPDIARNELGSVDRTTDVTILHTTLKSKLDFLLKTEHGGFEMARKLKLEETNEAPATEVIENIANGQGGIARQRDGSKALGTETTKQSIVRLINRKKKHATGRINVFLYRDIIPNYDNTNAHWNPLFPRFPHQSHFTHKLEDDDWVRTTITRRFLGYLHLYKSGFYTVKVDTRMGVDVLIFDRVISNNTIILRLTISEDDMRKMNISGSQLYHAQSDEVWLEKDRAYPIDVTHGTLFYGRLTLSLKCKGDSRYSVIDAKYLSPLYNTSNINVVLPESYAYTRGIPELRRKFNEDKRLTFATMVQVSSESCKTGLAKCSYSPGYLFRGDNVRLYYGQGYVQKDQIYPYDHTNYHDEPKTWKKFLNPSIAKQVAMSVFNSINQANKGIYKLESIVHVEENSEKRRYFVELDLQSTIDGKLYRFSDYVLRTKLKNNNNKNNSKFCLPQEYSNQWRHNVMIYLVCVVKNQRQWFQYLIQSLEELIDRTNDRNLHLIIVDFHSSDVNLKRNLQDSKLNYTLLQMDGNFSKVKALNEGVRHIPNNDSIVFVMDLQLQIPDHIFDQARKHTIQGRAAYCPILIRLSGFENPEYTKLSDYSIWQDIGYGMMSIFKSDWDRIGGMNEKMFGEKWGGEDWEFVDRVIVGRLELFHHRLPGFYHIYHSTLGTWDGTKLS